MNAPSPMSYQPTFWDSLPVISSPGSADGRLPAVSPDSPMIIAGGPDPAPARRSPARGKRSSARNAEENRSHIRSRLESLLVSPVDMNGWPTSVTFTRSSCASSLPASRQSSLESRLRERMDSYGSPEYALRWKPWDMILGPPICALRASPRRKSANESCGERTGWPTPMVPNGGRVITDEALKTGKRANGTKVQIGLENAATLVGWATPTTRDHKDTTGMATTGINPDGTERNRMDQLGRQVGLVTGWATPTCADANRGEAPRRPHDKGVPLNQQISGLTPDSSSAATESTAGFQLNPAFSLWLMGYPTSWHDVGVCALRSLREQATPSSRNSRRSSSSHSSKP